MLHVKLVLHSTVIYLAVCTRAEAKTYSTVLKVTARKIIDLNDLSQDKQHRLS